jgi:signal transduction histidine kinase
MKLRPTVRLKLTLAYTISFLLAGAVLLSVNYALVSNRERSKNFGVVVQLQNGTGIATLAGPGQSVAPVTAADPGVVKQIGPGVGIIGVPGDTVGGTGFGGSATGGSVTGGPVTGAPAVGLPDPKQLIAQVTKFQNGLRSKALHTLAVESGLALGAMALLSIGLGWVLAARALRPLHNITATARQLSAENLSDRINLQGPPDELKELADTFDGMLGRIDSAFESQRRFVANASHELRTPLAIQRALVDVALRSPDTTGEEWRQMAEGVRDVTDRSERLIESLLVLARSQQELVTKDAVNLATVALDALDHVRAEAEERGLSIESELSPAQVSGDRARLERLAGNLVENAVGHNTPGGWIRVSTSADRTTARLAVASSGPVVDESEVPGLFEPFRRGGGVRTGSDRGTGLGLSIVRSVVAAHGGRIEAHAVPGGGLTVTVELAAR